MDKKYLSFLTENHFELILTPTNQAQKYIEDRQEIMRTIKTAMDGRDNLFSNELRSLLLTQLADHTTELPKGMNMQYGQFYYVADRLADRIANADQRCRNYNIKFYTNHRSVIANSYEYNSCNSYLVYEYVVLRKSIKLADFTGESGVGENLYSAIKNVVEDLKYNIEIPKTRVGFVFRMIEELGFEGVIYKPQNTDTYVIVVFDPDKCVNVKMHKVVQPSGYEAFFNH